MKKILIDIAIPCFNEQENIGFLLRELLSQKQKSFSIDNIYVVNDGSSDDTALMVKKVRSKKIKIIDDKKRLGLGERENQIFALCNQEVMVLIQGDVLIKDRYFIEKLIKPIVNSGADLTAASLNELSAQTLVEKILEASMKFKKEVFESYNKGNNLFTCYGPARAFSKKLYKSMNLKSGVGEDGYSYIFSHMNNFVYQYVKGAKVYYRLPTNLADHVRQSLRYERAKVLLASQFGQKVAEKNYYLPKSLVIKSFLKSMLSSPVMILGYLVIIMYVKFKVHFSETISDQWQISQSSKSLGRRG